MKKIFIILLAIVVLITMPTAFAVDIAYASTTSQQDVLPETPPSEYASFVSSAYLYAFVNKFPNRTTASVAEKNAADFLADAFHDFGLNFGASSNSYIKKVNVNSSGYESYESQNVIGIKKASIDTEKFIVVGAPYDNNYSSITTDLLGNTVNNSSKSNGAISGTGIATMMTIIDKIKDASLSVNVVFIAFGADYDNYRGVQSYADQLSETERNNMLGLFFLDNVAAGDNLYLYCGEGDDIPHEKFIRSNLSDKIQLTDIPENKNIFIYESEETGLSYYNEAMGAVSYFMSSTPIVSFFSGNWHAGEKGLIESDSHVNIEGTALDTIEKLNEYYGELLYTRMDGVADTITSIIADAEVASVFESSYSISPEIKAKNNLKVVEIVHYVIIGLFVTALVFMAVYYSKQSKKIPIENSVNDNETKKDNASTDDPFADFSENNNHFERKTDNDYDKKDNDDSVFKDF